MKEIAPGIFEPVKTLRERLAEVAKNAPAIPDEEIAKQHACGVCRDMGFEWAKYIETGERKRCACSIERIRVERFRKALELTPRKFREIYGITDGLNSIIPNAEIHPNQPAEIEKIRARPDQSYFLYGMTGTQKTSIAVALMQEAGKRSRLVNFGIGKQIIDDIRTFQLKSTKPMNRTFYSLDQLETDEPMCFVIDELDDTLATFSSYTLSTLFAIVELVQSYQHQVIITSNDDLETILNNWCRRDANDDYSTANYANKIGRRLKETCVEIDFSEQEG